MVGTPAVIQNRQAKPPRYSLIVAADALEGPEITDGRWQQGFTWDVERHSGGGLLAHESNGQGGSAAISGETELVDLVGDPYIVWATHECSTFGFKEHEYVERAARLLKAVESFHLAAELWDGAVAAAESNRNRFLSAADCDTLTSTAVSVVTGVGLIEDALAFYLRGGAGMIHVTPQVLTHMCNAQIVERDGKVWRTCNGHKVVADAGYSGDGEGAAVADSSSQFIYGTDMIDVLLGDIMTPNATEAFQEMDRTVNTVTVRAQRMAGWRWDGQAHVNAEVNVGIAGIGAGS